MQAEINGLMMAKKNSAVLWTVDQTGDVITSDGREKAQKNIGLGSTFVKAQETGKFVTHVSRIDVPGTGEVAGELKIHTANPTLSDIATTTGDENKSIVIDNTGNMVTVALSASQNTGNATTSFVSAVTEGSTGNITVTTSPITSAAVNTAGIVPLIDDITNVDGTIVTNKETYAVTPLGVKSALDPYVYSVDNALSTTSENPVQNKVITAALNGKVDSTDSRLAYDADVLIAVYTTQSSGTTLEELRTAYHAGKKIYVKIGGSIGSDSYEELIPLSYVRNSVVNNESVIVGFYFESQIDPVLNEGQAGTMITYYRDSGGWSYKLGYVYYAESSGESNQANYAKGYVEGEGIAQALAGRMNTTANNAATEALDNLMTKLGSPSSADAIAELSTIMAVSYNGTNWNKLRPVTLWNYIDSKVSAAGYAKRPRIALLDSPLYYQDGATVEYVEVYDKNTSIWVHQGYQILGNKANSSSNWGVCHVPTNVDYSKGYCEIDFDLQLWSYLWNGSEREAYANLDMPYIIRFVATTGSNDGASPSMIALDDSKIFATHVLSIDCMRGTMASFAHVRLCGRLQSSTSANHAIYIGARMANDWGALITRAKMANVRIKYYDDVASMT